MTKPKFHPGELPAEMREWLCDHDAVCLWQTTADRKKIGPKSVVIEAWSVGGWVVITTNSAHGCDVFTACKETTWDATLADAANRLGVSTPPQT